MSAFRFGCAAIVGFLALLVVLLAGCSAPQVVVRSEKQLGVYHRVFMTPMRADPRHIRPRVAVRLRQAGFEVVEARPGEASPHAQGSGLVLTPAGHVLAAAHVVKGRTDATLWIQGKRYLGRVLALDTNLDAAILSVAGEAAHFRPLAFAADATCRLGQDVYTLGFPLAEVLGSAPRLNKGLVSATVGIEDNAKYLQISAAVQPGNSGGPLLNERGEAVGMVVGTLNPLRVLSQTGGSLPQNVNFALKVGPLVEFLEASHVARHVATNGAASTSFERAQESLVLVRSGIVDEAELKTVPLLCRIGYVAHAGADSSLGFFGIEFFDGKTGRCVVRAAVRDTSLFRSDESMLDRIMAAVLPKFFPGQTDLPAKN